MREDGIIGQGFALIIEKEFSKNMTTHDLVSEKIIAATFDKEDEQVIEAYAPDSSYEDDLVEDLYLSLQEIIDTFPRKQNLILLGHFNAKVRKTQDALMTEVKGKYELGKRR